MCDRVDFRAYFTDWEGCVEAFEHPRRLVQNAQRLPRGVAEPAELIVVAPGKAVMSGYMERIHFY